MRKILWRFQDFLVDIYFVHELLGCCLQSSKVAKKYLFEKYTFKFQPVPHLLICEDANILLIYYGWFLT
jgi:hypothetical protein